jgi:RecA/RadA recombinase
MVLMITNASTLRRSTADQIDAAEQLSLLPNDTVTARFRLSRDTRERGLRHVAEIRQMLSERADLTSGADNAQTLHTRRDQAA